MRGTVVAIVVAALVCVGCTPASEGAASPDDAPGTAQETAAPTSTPASTAAPTAGAEADAVFGPEERETYEALAPFEVVEVISSDGTPIAMEVPAEANCAEDQCAVYAAIHFLAMQDDVIAGRATESWAALSSPDCYFCIDTLVVREELLESGVTVDGGHITVNDVPTVFTEEFIFEMPPFDDFDLPNPSLVALSLSTDQAEITYTDEDETRSRESMWVTFLMVMSWNGNYWRVETVALT